MAISPNQQQSVASNPRHSVWVSANAGTGKTKILTDRVLRLLLEGHDAHKILCLTFTNAAAKEMALRVHHILQQWSIASDADLRQLLTALTGNEPSQDTINHARRLFTHVIDQQDSLHIQTIHAFCQSLLKRFPLEAGILPHFTILDEQTASQLTQQAWAQLLCAPTLRNAEEDPLTEAINHLSQLLGDQSLHGLINDVINQRETLLFYRQKHGDMDAMIAHLYDHLGLKMSDQIDDYIHDFSASTAIDSALDACIAQLATGTAKQQEKAQILVAWRHADTTQRIDGWPDILAVFFTQKDQPRKLTAIASKTLLENSPALHEHIEHIIAHFETALDRIRSHAIASQTRSILIVVDALLTEYERLKAQQSFLDYSDLILHTQQLLKQPDSAAWVMYKLDASIEHLLIDEAQDTSPVQWDIITHICTDFFSGESSVDHDRTVFVVGDEKQSIFSFQGADPHAFSSMHRYFSQATQHAQKSWKTVNLETSFRSTEPILQLVDTVFSDANLRQSVSQLQPHIHHEAYRSKHPGNVQFWPITDNETPQNQTPVEEASKEQPDEKSDNSTTPWALPTKRIIRTNPQYQLANQIAQQIALWFKEKRFLASKNRPIEAGDIMILLRSRTAFVDYMIRECKRLHIPVAGVDRMILTEHIAVMDLIALGEFLLLPDDDLSLATILKSPLCGVSEEQLFTLCHDRQSTSLWSRMQSLHGELGLVDAHHFLSDLLNKVDFTTPFELYHHILHHAGGYHAFTQHMGDEVSDPLQEFMHKTLEYERNHIPSLQGFMQWITAGNSIIKRDLEQNNNAVRILTVHGSKGLQAPIVFLPDTTRLPKMHDPILWDDEASLLYWAGNKDQHNQHCQNLYNTRNARTYDEYIRLLYVALTRAEDELYIGGWTSKSRGEYATWHDHIDRHIHTIEAAKTIPLASDHNITVTELSSASHDQEHTPSSSQLSMHVLDQHNEIAITSMPEYFHQLAKETPSISSIETVTKAASPEKNTELAYGVFVHQLLEYLPKVAPDDYQSIATNIAHHHALEADLKTQAIKEAVQVIAHPELSLLFSAQSHSELPVIGHINDQLYKGVIDRLVYLPDRLLILDYKTHRDPPATIPKSIKNQLTHYRTLLTPQYPNHTIECAVLWTANCQLDYVEPHHNNS